MSDGVLSAGAGGSRLVRFVVEFGVIFLGVTLSLLADDWRQNRVDRADERMVLEELLADLEAGADDMGRLRDGARDDAAAALWVRHHLSDAQVDPDGLSRNLRTIYNWYSYQGAGSTTYAGLRSTGRLTLIEDDSLRREITTFFEERVPYIQGFYEIYGDQWMILRESVARDVEWRIAEGTETWLSYDGLALRRPWAEVPSDPLLLHYLEMVGVLGEVITTRSSEVLAENAELRRAITRTLAR